MRQVLTLALNHTTTRNAFGSSLAKRPMMANVLADMAVEVEAATLMALRVARATDHIDTNLKKKPSRAWRHRLPNTSTALRGGDGQRGAAAPWWQRFRGGPPDGKSMRRHQQRVGRCCQHDVHGRAPCDATGGHLDALFAELADVRGQDSRFDAYVTALGPLLDEMQHEGSLLAPATEGIGPRCKVQNF